MSAAGAVRRARHAAWLGLAVLAIALSVTSCSQWRGIANVAMPGGPGSGPRNYTVYVQMPDTLALTVNSKVMVADVVVGQVRAITLRNWVATLTVDLQDGVTLPANATAKIGQTSLLGSQHLELAPPQDNPMTGRLGNGDTIPLKNSSAYPTTEQTLASIATLINGGGVGNLEVISNEVYNIVNGRADKIRALLTNLDTFTAKLDEQIGDITHAIDSADRLLAIAAEHTATLDGALTALPPLVKYLSDSRGRVIDAVVAPGPVQ